MTASLVPARGVPTALHAAPVASSSHLRHLSLVGPRRSRMVPACIAMTVVMVFTSLFGNAVIHSDLVSGQTRLDAIEEQRLAVATRNERLELEVAQLESPERLVNEAKRLGLIEPDEITWLTPRPDEGAPDRVVDERPGSSADERASGDPADGG